MASIVEAILQGQFKNDHGFTPGARYELLEQGFQGHTATFLTLESKKERARVLLTLLNSEQRGEGSHTSSGSAGFLKRGVLVMRNRAFKTTIGAWGVKSKMLSFTL